MIVCMYLCIPRVKRKKTLRIVVPNLSNLFYHHKSNPIGCYGVVEPGYDCLLSEKKILARLQKHVHIFEPLALLCYQRDQFRLHDKLSSYLLKLANANVYNLLMWNYFLVGARGGLMSDAVR